MTGFDHLKNSYAFAIQAGIDEDFSYNDCKNANDIIHKFCDIYIDNSNCSDVDKKAMKQELKLLKETLDNEIDNHYQQR